MEVQAEMKEMAFLVTCSDLRPMDLTVLLLIVEADLKSKGAECQLILRKYIYSFYFFQTFSFFFHLLKFLKCSFYSLLEFLE